MMLLRGPPANTLPFQGFSTERLHCRDLLSPFLFVHSSSSERSVCALFIPAAIKSGVQRPGG